MTANETANWRNLRIIIRHPRKEDVVEEVWKDVPDYEGYYQVSNLGNVRSLDRDITIGGKITHRKGRIKKQWINSDGYCVVKLSKDGIDRTYPVHMLVINAFIQRYKYEDGIEGNHIDTDRTNNRVDNLELLTHQENVNHSTALGHYKHYGKDNPNYGKHTLKKRFENEPGLSKKLQSRPGNQNGRCVPIILKDCNTGEEIKFDYLREAAKYLLDNNITPKKYALNSIANRLKRCLTDETEYCGYKIKCA